MVCCCDVAKAMAAPLLSSLDLVSVCPGIKKRAGSGGAPLASAAEAAAASSLVLFKNNLALALAGSEPSSTGLAPSPPGWKGTSEVSATPGNKGSSRVLCQSRAVSDLMVSEQNQSDNINHAMEEIIRGTSPPPPRGPASVT